MLLANDPRVKLAESDQIVAAMNERSIPVTYVVFPDEGHGFAKPENRLAFMAVTEQFLSEHLGGRAEAVGVDVQDSTAQVRDLGNLQVEGVALWDASEAPADVPEAAPAGTVTFADLTPEQQAQVQQFLDRVDTIPLDQLGMMKSLLEAQRSNVPPAELPIFEFMLQTINEKIAEES